MARLVGPAARVVYGPRYRVELQGTLFDSRRGERILSFLAAERLISRRAVHSVRPAPLGALRRVHDDAYLDSLQEPGALTPVLGFALSDARQDEYLLAHRAQVAGTLLATRLALAGRGVTVNLGGGFHHALRDRGQGFCVFNDIALAVADRRAAGFRRNVLVVDLDLHDGDGTRALFAEDETVHTLSIHNRHLGSIEARASTSVELGDGVGDDAYLAALHDLLPGVLDAVRPGLAIYLAGADPACDDALGNWLIGPDAMLERDRFVLRCLRGEDPPTPTVVLLAGGYGELSWRYPARFLSTLFNAGRAVEPPDTSAQTLAHFRRTARMLNEGQLTAEAYADDDNWQLNEADFDTAISRDRPTRFLNYYSQHGLELALERYGLFDRLRALGHANLRLELQLDHPVEHMLRIVTLDDGGSSLIELRARRDGSTLPGLQLLTIEWLLLQNPAAQFTPAQPRLPGQTHPGLGLLREIVTLLVLVCERLELDGIAFVPAHYHIAARSERHFRFLDPAAQARFLALRRALRGQRLPDATALLEGGAVVERGTRRSVRWEPAVMAVAVGPRLKVRLLGERYDAEVQRLGEALDYVLAAPN